jgi:putative nucleotidyltransferase with HDIG domain
VETSSSVILGSDSQQIDACTFDALRPSIALLSAAHGYRDPFTVEHQNRVAGLAVTIGSGLGLSAGRLEVLRLAAIVHDIGKIGLPAEILGKPGALSDPEYALIKGHCVIGYNILGNIHTPSAIAEIVYQHHERLDGSGYPRGLSGADILLESRILAVADVFDAMTSNRAYRPGWPRDVVLGELHTMAGRLLDPDAVDACRDFILAGSLANSDARACSAAA